MNFPFGTNGKFIILGVPILKHIRVMFSFKLQATSDCNDRSTDDPDTSGAQPGTTKTIDPSYTTEAHSKHMTSKPSSSLTEKPKTSSATATGVSTSAAETSTVGPKTSALSTSGVKSSAQTSSSPQTGALSSAGPKTNHPSTSGPATAYLQTGAHSAASAESHTSIKHTENQQTTGGQEISTDTSNNKKTTRTLGNGADMGAQRSGAIADNSGKQTYTSYPFISRETVYHIGVSDLLFFLMSRETAVNCMPKV